MSYSFEERVLEIHNQRHVKLLMDNNLTSEEYVDLDPLLNLDRLDIYSKSILEQIKDEDRRGVETDFTDTSSHSNRCNCVFCR